MQLERRRSFCKLHTKELRIRHRLAGGFEFQGARFIFQATPCMYAAGRGKSWFLRPASTSIVTTVANFG
jgi:hypothetical protein